MQPPPPDEPPSNEPSPHGDGPQQPPYGGGSQEPPYGGQQRPYGGGQQQPSYGGGPQQPQYGGGPQQPPSYGGEQEPPHGGGQYQPPPYYGGQPPPSYGGGQQQPPSYGGQQEPAHYGGGPYQPSPYGGEQQPPYGGGPQQPPSYGGQQEPPYGGGPYQPPPYGGPQQPPYGGGPQQPPYGPPPVQPPPYGPPPYGQPPYPAPWPRGYPVTFAVDYPERDLSRLTTFFRLITIIPIGIVLGTVAGGTWQTTETEHNSIIYAAAGGLLIAGPFLMILFRQKYPRWWFDFNLQLQRFIARVGIYLALMDDRYPSTDEEQAVHLYYPYPDARTDLNRWLPLVKWLLAIPHYIVLFFLEIGATVAVIVAWFAIVITARYPRVLFDFVEGVIRWHLRVVAYAFVLVTDEYPPFSLD